MRAAEAVAPARAVRTVAATFLRPGQVGPAVIDVAVLALDADLHHVGGHDQPGRSAGRHRADHRHRSRSTGHDWSTPADDGPAPFAEAVPFTPPPQILHFHQADLRLDPATIPNGDADEARIAGYVRPKHGGRVVDTAWLTMIGDWFPPSPFRRVPIPVGGVSVDYTVHVHHTPVLGDDEWLQAVLQTPQSEAGLALEHGTISTVGGLVVAETFHTRWTG